MKSLSRAGENNQRAMERTGRYDKAVGVSVLADEHRVEVCPVARRWNLGSRLLLAKYLWFKFFSDKINPWSCRKLCVGNPHNDRESCWIQEICVRPGVDFVHTVTGWRPSSVMFCSGCWRNIYIFLRNIELCVIILEQLLVSWILSDVSEGFAKLV